MRIESLRHWDTVIQSHEHQWSVNMGDLSPVGEEKILSIGIKASGGASSLTVTTARVYGTNSRGIFGKDDTSIPIGSVDSVLFGWSRVPGILFVALVMICVGLVAMAQLARKEPGYAALGIGAVALVIFFAYRPLTLIIASSGGRKLGGRPSVGMEETQKFVTELCALLAQKRTSS